MGLKDFREVCSMNLIRIIIHLLSILSILSIYIYYLKGRRKKEVKGGKVGNGRRTGEREEPLEKKDFTYEKKKQKKK